MSPMIGSLGGVCFGGFWGYILCLCDMTVSWIKKIALPEFQKK